MDHKYGIEEQLPNEINDRMIMMMAQWSHLQEARRERKKDVFKRPLIH